MEGNVKKANELEKWVDAAMVRPENISWEKICIPCQFLRILGLSTKTVP